MKPTIYIASVILLLSLSATGSHAQLNGTPRVLALYTAKEDAAHISFVLEARPWLDSLAAQENMALHCTNDWSLLNDDSLATIDLVIFLDTRPEDSLQRYAFEKYMRHGGAWLGFHFAAFALTPSAYPDNWTWYQNEFLGCGAYKSNSWKPTRVLLKVEDPEYPAMQSLPPKFESAANEWYRWENDLRRNPQIDILLSIDSSSFPVGTGPKPQEIWHSGYYPIAWTNRNYRMIYMNMGHNDMDYTKKPAERISGQFESLSQAKFIANCIRFLAVEGPK